MCWIGTKDNEIEMQIAAEDIPIFKVVECKGCIFSPYYYSIGVTYILGEEYRTGMKIRTVEDYMVVESGFHSYSRQDCFYADIGYGISIYLRNSRAKEEKKDGDWCLINRFDYTPYDEIVVLEGIIPKGSCYYKNDNGEIVSDRIVLNGVLADDEQ